MSTPGTTRPGGRTARTRAAVLDAAIAELIEAGYAGCCVEHVADRSGVHKATIYRRWGTLDALLSDAFTEYAARSAPAPDTGDVEADLRQIARSIAAWLASKQGEALVRAVIAAGHNSPLAAGIQRFWADRHHLVADVLTRAVQRGQLPAGVNPADASRQLCAPLYTRLLITDEPLDEHAADQAAATTVAAARAGTLSPAPGDPG
jgi:AcrR family transcriptional regulator